MASCGECGGLGLIDDDELVPCHRPGRRATLVVDEQDVAGAGGVVERDDVADVVSIQGPHAAADLRRAPGTLLPRSRSTAQVRPGRCGPRARRPARRDVPAVPVRAASATGTSVARSLMRAASASRADTSCLAPDMWTRSISSCSGSGRVRRTAGCRLCAVRSCRVPLWWCRRSRPTAGLVTWPRRRPPGTGRPGRRRGRDRR